MTSTPGTGPDRGAEDLLRHGLQEIGTDIGGFPPHVGAGARGQARRRRRGRAGAVIAAVAAAVAAVPAAMFALMPHQQSAVTPAVPHSSRPTVDPRCRDVALGTPMTTTPTVLPADANVVEAMWCTDDVRRHEGRPWLFAVEMRATTGLDTLVETFKTPDRRTSTDGDCVPVGWQEVRIWLRLGDGTWTEGAWPRKDCRRAVDPAGITAQTPFERVAEERIRNIVPASAMKSLGDLKCPGYSEGGQPDYGAGARGEPATEVVERARKVMSSGRPKDPWKNAATVTVEVTFDASGGMFTAHGLIVWFEDPQERVVAGVQFRQTTDGGYLFDLNRKCFYN